MARPSSPTTLHAAFIACCNSGSSAFAGSGSDALWLRKPAGVHAAQSRADFAPSVRGASVKTEVYVAPEMIAAGVEAMAAARRDCLTDGEIVLEIYLAMYLYGIKAMTER